MLPPFPQWISRKKIYLFEKLINENENEIIGKWSWKSSIISLYLCRFSLVLETPYTSQFFRNKVRNKINNSQWTTVVPKQVGADNFQVHLSEKTKKLEDILELQTMEEILRRWHDKFYNTLSHLRHSLLYFTSPPTDVMRWQQLYC